MELHGGVAEREILAFDAGLIGSSFRRISGLSMILLEEESHGNYEKPATLVQFFIGH
jgi:hypothetical protein